MAKVAKIKLNSAGVRRLLKSKEMQAICTEHAEEIAARCGEGYAVDSMQKETDVNGFRWLDYDSDLWMTLDPGDNVLRLTADEGRENLTATVTAPKGVAAGV